MARPHKLILLATAVLVLPIISIPAITVFASNYGSGYYGTCPYGAASTTCSISISNNGFTLFLAVAPIPTGNCTIQSDQVSVSTDDPNGYSLTLANESPTTGLNNVDGSASSIPASGGTPASPQALTNTWGYRVDGWSSFGAGPTSPATNAAPNGSITFAGTQPSNGTADTIAQTSTVSNTPVSTTVWYGICTNTNLNVPAGSYTSTVEYSASAN